MLFKTNAAIHLLSIYQKCWLERGEIYMWNIENLLKYWPERFTLNRYYNHYNDRMSNKWNANVSLTMISIASIINQKEVNEINKEIKWNDYIIK